MAETGIKQRMANKKMSHSEKVVKIIFCRVPLGKQKKNELHSICALNATSFFLLHIIIINKIISSCKTVHLFYSFEKASWQWSCFFYLKEKWIVLAGSEARVCTHDFYWLHVISLKQWFFFFANVVFSLIWIYSMFVMFKWDCFTSYFFSTLFPSLFLSLFPLHKNVNNYATFLRSILLFLCVCTVHSFWPFRCCCSNWSIRACWKHFGTIFTSQCSQ